MYTKSNFRTNNDIIIPENYSGNAFFESPTQEAPCETSEEPLKATDEAILGVSQKEPLHQNSFLTPFLPPKVSKTTGLFSNIGLEELLIIGVLILLSQSDADDDILLLLFLLLFYK